METRFFTCDTCGHPSQARNGSPIAPDAELPATWMEIRDGKVGRHFCCPACFRSFVNKEWS